MGQKLEQEIPDAGLVIHEGAGHYAYLEKADETARVMDYFFKQTTLDQQFFNFLNVIINIRIIKKYTSQEIDGKMISKN